MPTLVIGTKNKKKLLELRDLLGDLDLTITDLSGFADVPEVHEDGGTFEANARKKASAFARAIGQWVLADDSGLVVPALNGEPGVDSALYAGTHGDDEANNNLLLKKLETVPEDQRSAYYVCVVALADPTGEVKAVAEGRCGGRIVADRRGVGGFGYDPLFLVPEYHRTFGELSLLVKQALSHRARAVMKLRPMLRNLLFPSPPSSGERG
jgi:XTP/dITP diphosphohydrolase